MSAEKLIVEQYEQLPNTPFSTHKIFRKYDNAIPTTVLNRFLVLHDNIVKFAKQLNNQTFAYHDGNSEGLIPVDPYR